MAVWFEVRSFYDKLTGTHGVWGRVLWEKFKISYPIVTQVVYLIPALLSCFVSPRPRLNDDQFISTGACVSFTGVEHKLTFTQYV